MGVNLYGVIHGIRTFVPIMLQQGEEGHVVNTASLAGLLPMPSMGVYTATKHAVVSISEVLFGELSAAGAPIGVSVLCPAFVSTRIMDSARNRPVELEARGPEPSPDIKAARDGFKAMIDAGMSPDLVADKVFAAIQNKQLYILHIRSSTRRYCSVQKELLGNGTLRLPPRHRGHSIGKLTTLWSQWINIPLIHLSAITSSYTK